MTVQFILQPVVNVTDNVTDNAVASVSVIFLTTVTECGRAA